ncbi:MAG: M10 family metallopeptidase domain-containing protein [Chloroflexota bacterium]|nr:M10 family metallopeptidase domain-containing protein [Chloroflexota bacterium]
MTRTRRPYLLSSGLLISLLAAQATIGSSITPTKSTIWNENQLVPYRWKEGSVPPAWIRPAIEGAVADSAGSRGSKAAVFERRDSATSWIGYTHDVCTAKAIGCATRNPPTSFTVRLRPHGHVFDWGTLRWCQFYESPPKGCFDAEMVTLHELGHVQGLNHVDDVLDSYLDSIMHATSRAKAKTGWNAHAFRRCDVGALQTLYRPLDAATPISTCMTLATTSTLVASSTSVAYKAEVTFTATLAIAADVVYKRLRGFPLSARTLILQRRAPGTTTWSTYSTLPATATDGTYKLVVYPTATYEWRALFARPASEGLLGSRSGVVTVTVAACTTACPMTAEDDGPALSTDGGGL